MDLSCFADIRDWVPGQDALCKKFRNNGKLIEFCGRSNEAGLFVVIAVYFGGAQRDCVMTLASFNCDGWSLIKKELRNFLPCKKPATLIGASSNNSGLVSQSTVVGMGIIFLFMVIRGNSRILKKLEPLWDIS